MFTINAVKREKKGKSENRRLRIENKFPAIIYGGKKDPISIEIDHNFFMAIESKDGFYSGTISILIDEKDIEQVTIKSVQRHHFKPKIQHIDFIRVE
jgi:large subunit ribosomal protein L25